jgi:glycosyltransferase involved in cell wall biosynthesis
VITVARELADGAASGGQCDATLVLLHGVRPEFEPPARARMANLDLPSGGGAQVFSHLQAWLEEYPQDVVFLNDVSELWPFLAYSSARARLVVVLHDEGRRYLEPVLSHSNVIDGLVVVAEFLVDLIKEAIPAAELPIRAIHNGTAFPDSSRNPRFDRGSLRLVYLGALDFFKKGVQDLPAVLARLTERSVNCELSIIGGESPRLRAMFERAGVSDRVRWRGWLPRASCFELAGEHDIIVIPSRCEAFGMVAIEAMGMGCVPVAYDIPSGLREIIRHGQTGCLVRFPRPRALADAIETLARDSGQLLAMSCAAARDVRSRFSAEGAGSEYVRFAEMVLSRAPARRCQLVGTASRRSPAVSGPSGALGSAFLRRALRRAIEPHPRLVRWSWRHLTG